MYKRFCHLFHRTLELPKKYCDTNIRFTFVVVEGVEISSRYSPSAEVQSTTTIIYRISFGDRVTWRSGASQKVSVVLGSGAKSNYPYLM